jgi:hypothetical protein
MHQVSPALYATAAESILLQCKGIKGEQVVYLNEAGLIVQAPVISTTLQNSVEMVLPAIESSQTAVAYDQVQQNVSRYQLLEKKGTKEGYRDNRIGLKVIVKRENN